MAVHVSLQTAGAYRWLDDWYMPMTGWATDEPAQPQACVRLVAGEGWMTESCSKPLPVVCKKSPGVCVKVFWCESSAQIFIFFLIEPLMKWIVHCLVYAMLF